MRLSFVGRRGNSSVPSESSTYGAFESTESFVCDQKPEKEDASGSLSNNKFGLLKRDDNFDDSDKEEDMSAENRGLQFQAKREETSFFELGEGNDEAHSKLTHISTSTVMRSSSTVMTSTSTMMTSTSSVMAKAKAVEIKPKPCSIAATSGHSNPLNRQQSSSGSGSQVRAPSVSSTSTSSKDNAGVDPVGNNKPRRSIRRKSFGPDTMEGLLKDFQKSEEGSSVERSASTSDQIIRGKGADKTSTKEIETERSPKKSGKVRRRKSFDSATLMQTLEAVEALGAASSPSEERSPKKSGKVIRRKSLDSATLMQTLEAVGAASSPSDARNLNLIDNVKVSKPANSSCKRNTLVRRKSCDSAMLMAMAEGRAPETPVALLGEKSPQGLGKRYVIKQPLRNRSLLGDEAEECKVVSPKSRIKKPAQLKSSDAVNLDVTDESATSMETAKEESSKKKPSGQDIKKSIGSEEISKKKSFRQSIKKIVSGEKPSEMGKSKVSKQSLLGEESSKDSAAKEESLKKKPSAQGRKKSTGPEESSKKKPARQSSTKPSGSSEKPSESGSKKSKAEKKAVKDSKEDSIIPLVDSVQKPKQTKRRSREKSSSFTKGVTMATSSADETEYSSMEMTETDDGSLSS